MMKNLIFNESKNASVRFFIYMSSMCVHIFTAFEEAVLKLYMYLGECPKIEFFDQPPPKTGYFMSLSCNCEATFDI